MATTSDDGFHEIQLDGKQLVFLFMAVTVVSVVIFLLGVLVGRNVRAEAASVDPLATPARTTEATGAAPPPPAVSNPGTPSATANEPLSYPQRLASGAQPRESLGAATPRTEPSTPPPAPEPASSATARSSAATPPGAPASTATSPPPAPAPAPAASAVAGEPKGAGYAIQLAALGKRDEADAIAQRLTGKGYAAYVMGPEAGAPAMYRVRVGKFKERREAEGVAAKLEKEEQFKPWIVR
jgi:DedD protein